MKRLLCTAVATTLSAIALLTEFTPPKSTHAHAAASPTDFIPKTLLTQDFLADLTTEFKTQDMQTMYTSKRRPLSSELLTNG